uniref:iron chelate uptake ABC transporter family permease subunit n=1 Tax=Nocardia brasiliensis TaxID=37326 RepID=UPI002457E055
ILGAVVLLAADVAARSLVHNADLPLGMLTSLIGGPVFFWFLPPTPAPPAPADEVFRRST